jgi:DNA-binding FrmR family transcriptional regulator
MSSGSDSRTPTEGTPEVVVAEPLSPSGATTLPSPGDTINVEDDNKSIVSARSTYTTYSTMSIRSTKPLHCQGCEEQLAVSFCKDCNFVFCQDCLDASHKVPAFRKHVIMDAARKPKDSAQCDFHRESKRVWCDTCGDIVCILCATAGAHKSHTTELVADMARRVRPQTAELLEKLRDSADQLDEAEISLDKEILRVNSESTQFETEVAGAVNSLQSMLDSMTKDILTQVAASKAKSLNPLSDKKLKVGEMKETVQTVFGDQPEGDDDVLNVAYNHTLRSLLKEMKPGSLVGDDIGKFMISCNILKQVDDAIRALSLVSLKFEAARVGLVVESVDSRRIVVRVLAPVSQAVSKYHLEYRAASQESWTVVSASADTSIELVGLKPFTLYTIRAKADELDWSFVEAATTLPKLLLSAAQFTDGSKLEINGDSIADLRIDEVEVELLRVAGAIEEKTEEEWISLRASAPIAFPLKFEASGAAQWEAMTAKARYLVGGTWSEFSAALPVKVSKPQAWTPSRFSRRKCGAGMKVLDSGAAVEQKEGENWVSCMTAEGIDTATAEGVYRWKMAVELLPKLHNVMVGLADSSHGLEGEYLGKTATTWALYSEVSASKKDRTLFKYHQKKKEALRGKLQSGDEVVFELKCFKGAQPSELSVKVLRKDEVVMEKPLFNDVTGKVYPTVCSHTKGFKARIAQ